MEESNILSNTKINHLLKHFDPISLKEMKAFALLNRSETKYVMDTNTFLEVLEDLSDYYKILEIKNKRRNAYQTLYFDSPDLEMYRNHHNGILNRYKVRIREYLDSCQSFLEIKFKNNRKKTLKKRIEIPKVSTHMNSELLQFISDNSKVTGKELKPALWNKYSRITLVSKNNIERLTFDLNLEFSDPNYSRTTALSGIVVAEVKHEAFSSKSDFVKLMQDKSVRSEGFSKYCIGISVLFSEVKKNNFKRKLLLVNKLSGSMC